MTVADRACLYALIEADRKHHEDLLRDFVTPVVERLRNSCGLDSLFFVRYNEPRWQLRFRVLGAQAWIHGVVRELVEGQLLGLTGAGIYDAYRFAEYERETARYGGPAGMRLAERLFLHDTLACIDYLSAERDGATQRTRREWNLLLTERFIDLFEFSDSDRQGYYYQGYGWTDAMGTWGDDDRRALDQRYESLRPGMLRLFERIGSKDPTVAWGGIRPTEIACRYLDSVAPLVRALARDHAAGRVEQDLVYLAWSYTHMACNRLGIDPTAEAVLRYLAGRYHRDRRAGV